MGGNHIRSCASGISTTRVKVPPPKPSPTSTCNWPSASRQASRRLIAVACWPVKALKARRIVGRSSKPSSKFCDQTPAIRLAGSGAGRLHHCQQHHVAIDHSPGRRTAASRARGRDELHQFRALVLAVVDVIIGLAISFSCRRCVRHCTKLGARNRWIPALRPILTSAAWPSRPVREVCACCRRALPIAPRLTISTLLLLVNRQGVAS